VIEAALAPIRVAEAALQIGKTGCILAMMSTIRIDKLGRVVLPKAIRDRLALAPGDALEVEGSEGTITLRPARQLQPMRKKQGVWVFSSGEPLSAATVRDTLERARRDRDVENAG